MARWRGLTSALTLTLLAGAAHCGPASDAPRGQVLLVLDTDAPVASQASADGFDFLTDAAVDTLRVEVLGPDNSIVQSADITAPDESNWPISFGIFGAPGAAVARVRIRAFRAQRSHVGTDADGGAKFFEPIAGYTIDRVVEVPVPSEKGVFAFEVILRSACRGNRPDFTQRTTCTDSDHPDADFRDGLTYLPNAQPNARPPMWWPSNADRGSTRDCAPNACPSGAVCIPGGFFMLGNLRVVGFGSAQRHDAVPAHPVAMEPFCIDATEMTVQRYQELDVGWPTDDVLGPEEPYRPAPKQGCTWAHLAPSVTGADEFPLDAPMNCVDHEDATRACIKAGGRLPTEAEWEYVATGMGRGSLFPWGDSPPTCATVALARKSTNPYVEATCGNLGIAPVMSFGFAQGGVDEITVRDAQSVFDLGGSVSEWVLDTFIGYGETSDSINCWQIEGVRWHPSCEVAGTSMSVRGGNFIDELELSYAALRWAEERTTHAEAIGFRCVYPLGDRDPKRPRTPVSSAPGMPENPDAGPPRPEPDP